MTSETDTTRTDITRSTQVASATQRPATSRQSATPPEPTEEHDPLEHSRMSLTDHLEELRDRLVKSVLAYMVGVIITYFFSTELFRLLKLPLTVLITKHPGSTLAMRSLSEGFMVELKVALIAGIFVACPVIFYQLWKFISPGLYEHEKRLALPVVISASFLFVTGAFFGYFVVFPYTFDFFLSYTSPEVSAVLSIDDYLDFASKMLAGFGLIFELPLVIFVLSWLGIVNHTQLIRIRRYVVVFNFVVAAVITPPDVVSQMFVAVPLVGLYELGILLSWMVGRKRKTDEDVERERLEKEGGFSV